MNKVPQILPRLSPSSIDASDHLGCGVQFRLKFRFLIIMGVFGKGATLHTVCRRMYETGMISEPALDKETGETTMVEKVNDATAYIRLDNICRDGQNAKSVVQGELDFLRACFSRLYGDNAMGHVDDEFLLNGTLLQLLKSLGGFRSDFSWSDVDPILALEALGAAADNDFSIELAKDTGTRWTKQTGGITVEPPHATTNVYPTEMGYRLFLDAAIAREKPIVLEFLGAGEGKSEDGRPARAQVLTHVIRDDDGEGPWRVSDERNRPLTMGSKPGRFGFCAISGIGQSIGALLPSGADPYCLSDDDLRSLASNVLNQAAMTTSPVIAIHRFELAKPDAAENRPSNTGGKKGSRWR